MPGHAREVVAHAARLGVNLFAPDDDHVQVACDETTTAADYAPVIGAFALAGATTLEVSEDGDVDLGFVALDRPSVPLPDWATRTDEYLTHPVFHLYRSETAMLRYLRRLSDQDLALDRTMIPLGSCTMKLNATAEMEPISWPQFADEGPVWRALSESDGTSVPVWRFFNRNTGAHFYTTSDAERQRILVTWPQYADEGAAFYVDASADALRITLCQAYCDALIATGVESVKLELIYGCDPPE